MTMTDPLFDESDLEVEAYYCIHGTFTGNPHGADYMCGWCEDGISDEDYRRAMTLQGNRRRRSSTAIAFLEDCNRGGYVQIPAMPEGFRSTVLAMVLTMAAWAR